MALLIYSFLIHCFYLLIRLAAPFNHKARLFVDGRKKEIPEVPSGEGKKIWFHCASLGEFEQARPLIEDLKRRGNIIILTFFSPSGYEVRKNYQVADHILYLPVDTSSNAKMFLDRIKPDIAVFIKYELWFNFISECGERKIPLFMVSGLFREDHYLFGLGRPLLPVLKNFTHFFMQDELSVRLLKQHGINQVSVAGDTRYDRVFDIMSSAREISGVKEFCKDSFVIVAGSTWEPDEQLLHRVLEKLSDKNIRLIIAPHNISEAGLKRTRDLFSDHVLFSKIDENSNSRVLIIDNIGMLSSLYRYGHYAYVGGGFGKAVHNVLEPLVYGMPVSFGPENKRFHEIQLILENGCGREIHNADQLFDDIGKYLKDPGSLQIQKEKARAFFNKQRGAVKKILTVLDGYLPLFATR